MFRRKGGGKFLHRYCSETCREAASRVRRGARFRKYALSEIEYLSLVDAQDNRCAVCGETPGPARKVDRYGLVVDHDHQTGAVRGLLCNRCNLGVGMFDDDPEKLMGAIAYLLRWDAGQLGEPFQGGAGRRSVERAVSKTDIAARKGS